jgi:hypothetical protein
MLLTKSDVHILEHAVYEVDDPTAEVLSPRTVAGDMNRNNCAAVAGFCFCGRSERDWAVTNLEGVGSATMHEAGVELAQGTACEQVTS